MARICCLLAICLLLAGPPGFAGPSNPARSLDPLGQKWLHLLDGGDYMESWNEASELLKRRVSKAAWDMTLIPIRMHTGALKSRRLVSSQFVFSLPDLPMGDYAILKYKTSFAKQQPVFETVTLAKEADGKWKVFAYKLHSQD